MRCFAPIVWLGILQVLVFSLISSSPELHELVHSDAHESGHHCLATDFQSGIVEQTMTAPVAVPDFLPTQVVNVVASPEVRVLLPVHLCGSLLEHGPPVFA